MAWDSNQRHNDKLKLNKLIISGLILLTPLTAWASGQYLIPTLLINGVVIVVIGSSILGLKIRGLGKLILFAIYVGSMYLFFYWVDVGHHSDNLGLINLGSAVVPSISVYGTYQIIKDKFQTKDK